MEKEAPESQSVLKHNLPPLDRLLGPLLPNMDSFVKRKASAYLVKGDSKQSSSREKEMSDVTSQPSSCRILLLSLVDLQHLVAGQHLNVGSTSCCVPRLVQEEACERLL